MSIATCAVDAGGFCYTQEGEGSPLVVSRYEVQLGGMKRPVLAERVENLQVLVEMLLSAR